MKNELKDALALLRKIKFSKDYKKFEFLDINRLTDNGHIQKMINSVRNMGVVRPVICVRITFVNGKQQLYVIDGQHLFKSLMAEDLEIPYVIIDVENKIDMIQKMAMLNNSSKSLTTLVFIGKIILKLKFVFICIIVQLIVVY